MVEKLLRGHGGGVSDDLRKTRPWPEVDADPYSVLNWCHVHENKVPCADCEDEREKQSDEEESEARFIASRKRAKR